MLVSARLLMCMLGPYHEKCWESVALSDLNCQGYVVFLLADEAEARLTKNQSNAFITIQYVSARIVFLKAADASLLYTVFTGFLATVGGRQERWTASF